MKHILPAIAVLSMAAFMACSPKADRGGDMTLSGLNPDNFKAVVDGDSTSLVTLRNASGMEVCITNYGGRVVSVMVPDAKGEMRDVVLGFDSVQAYFPENNPSDFGAAIGRYANRINQGRFVLDGDTFKLPQNNFGHCLHGGTDMGTRGWQYRVYRLGEVTDSSVVMTMASPAGDNGFPGAVTAKVTYTVTADNALRIDYEAVTDAPTVINLTNHSYFNLSGDPALSVDDELLWIDAEAFTPVDSTFMTTGEIIPVKDTPMDFTVEKLIGRDIEKMEYIQIKNGNGYDHNYVLATAGDINKVAARLTDPRSGIVMEMLTTEPGVQFYTGNFLDGTVTGKGSKVYGKRHALCLETQHYPDSPNKPQWPSTVLRPGDTYRSTCIYRFSTKK